MFFLFDRYFCNIGYFGLKQLLASPVNSLCGRNFLYLCLNDT